jgi:hypothetical protein
MSILTGKDARDWHDAQGRHTRPHPATYMPRKSDWTAADRRYAEHLDRHQELSDNPEPMRGDSEAVTALFEHITLLERIIAKEKLMIRALRERAAAYPEADGREYDDRVQKLTRMIREGGLS